MGGRSELDREVCRHVMIGPQTTGREEEEGRWGYRVRERGRDG